MNGYFPVSRTTDISFASLKQKLLKMCRTYDILLSLDLMCITHLTQTQKYFICSALFKSFLFQTGKTCIGCSSSSSVAPAGLRGELRLWREGPPRTC